MGEGKRRGAEEQEDVLEKKGALDSTRGLQQYEEDAFPDGPPSGTSSSGTAERSAKIGAAQIAASKKQPEGE